MIRVRWISKIRSYSGVGSCRVFPDRIDDQQAWPTSFRNESLEADAGPMVRRLAQRFGGLPQVVAVALAGSRGGGVPIFVAEVESSLCLL
jgi:hypothetical protein